MEGKGLEEWEVEEEGEEVEGVQDRYTSMLLRYVTLQKRLGGRLGARQHSVYELRA